MALRENGASLVHVGVPARMHCYFEVTDEVYVAAVLKHAGWTLTMKVQPWMPRSPEHGQVTIDLPFELTWQQG